jgi:hypothetical protein
MLITDQLATAPCTDRVQEWFRSFEAKLLGRQATIQSKPEQRLKSRC